jgi:hypothetical protein
MTIAPAASPASQAAAAQLVLRIATGYVASAALHAALRLDIPDRLVERAKRVSALAAETGVHEDTLYRVLRALGSIGIFKEGPEATFSLTPAGAMLLNRPGSLRPTAMWVTQPLSLRLFAEIMRALGTGQPTLEAVAGQPLFALLESDQEQSALFNDAMTSMTATVMPAVLKAYDFSDAGRLVDVGGGHGYLLAAILRQYPEAHGVLFDREHVVAGAGSVIADAGVGSRCEIRGGDFFDGVPAGGDTYLLKNIVHDWDDDAALTILRHVRRAIDGRPSARVLIIDSVIEPGVRFDVGSFMDLNMLLLLGGRERTAAEFTALVQRAGLALTRIVRTESPVCVLETRAIPV